MPFGHRLSLLGHPLPGEELSPPHGRLTGRTAGPRRGFRVPHARAATGEGALYTPGTTVLIPTDGDFRPASAASQRPVPAPRSSLRGLRLTRSQRGFKPFARPVFPSLWPPGWNGPPLDSSLGLRTPPTQSRTTHAEVGTGHRARTWNYRLNSHSLSISNPVVHSMRATSRRTSPFRSSACRLSDDQSSRHRGRPPAAASRLLQRRNVATAGGRFSGRAAVRTKPIGVLRPVRRARHSIVEISKRARAPRRTGLFARGEDMDMDPESPIAARRATPSYLKGLGGPAYLPRNPVRRRVCGRSVTDGIAAA